MKNPYQLAAFASLSLLLTAGAVAAVPSASYHRLPDISGPDGRWDFASWDAEHGRAIVAHGTDVLLVDPNSPATVRSVGQIQGAHAALAIPGGNRLLVTSGRDNTVRILDSVSGSQLASIGVADDPDAAILSKDGHTAYVMAAKAGVISVIDLDHQIETARISVKPGLEVPVLFGSHMLAVNDEDSNEIELIDLTAGKMVGSIAMPGCEGPTGLALSPGPDLALATCANGKAALIDLKRRKVVKLLPIGLGPDTAIWDTRHGRFLVPCGKSGTLTVITLGRHGASGVSTVASEVSARTATQDPATGNIYLPAARFQPAIAGKRPDLIPGSFHLVVLAPR